MIWKLVERTQGYAPAWNFKFVVYAEVDTETGLPLGDPITDGISDGNGAVPIGPLAEIKIGQTYYVFEEMRIVSNGSQTINQAEMYKYGANNPQGYIEVVALPDPEYKETMATPFYNDIRMGMLYIEKQIETESGHVPGEGFEFAAYAAIDNETGQPLGSPIAYATSDAEGKAVFGPTFAGVGPETRSVFTPGTEYFVFEIMTEDQAAIYEYGAQGAYVAVSAIEEDDEEFEYTVFSNDIIEVSGSMVATGSVQEEYYREYYKPVYKTASASGTVVSWINGTGDAKLPEGITGASPYNNGFTIFKIDAAMLEAFGDDGVNIWLARSDGSNTPLTDNTTYNLRIVGNKLMVSTYFTSGDYRAVVSDSQWPQSEVNGPHDSPTEINLPADADGDGCFWFFFHIDGCSYYVQPSEVVDYELDYRSADKYSRPYVGDVKVTVVDAENKVVYDDEIGSVEDLGPGIYTVTIYAGTTVVYSTEITIYAGETTEVNFGTLVIPGHLGAPEQYGLPEAT